jgi:hypothetical protein
VYIYNCPHKLIHIYKGENKINVTTKYFKAML